MLGSLGAGGEGYVVKALDRQHDRLIALKIREARGESLRDELLNEARVLLAVPPHAALPLVREDFFDGDTYVVAMDWVEGTDLARLLGERGRPGLAPSSVLAYLAQAAEALTHLHAQDPPVIHGDVKPANLILTKGGRVKLVDFGLSSAPAAPRRRAGTPGFRAPELAADGAPSRASDVFSLAATAFALLTGSAPAGVLPSWEGIEPAQAEQLEAALRRGSGDRSGAPPRDAGRARGEPAQRLGRGTADRRDDVLPVGHRGLGDAVGRRPRDDGRGARPPRRDHRRAGRGPRRPGHQVDGRGRLDGVGVRVGAAGARGRARRHARPAGGAVAGRSRARRPLRAAHGRGRATRGRLLRADAQPGRATARAGRRLADLRLGGDGGARRQAPPGRLRAGRPRSAPAARAARPGADPRPQGSRAQRPAAGR